MSRSDVWKCKVCGYVHEGDAPPDACPVCSVAAELFEPLEAPGASTDGSDLEGHLVILGAGVAGLTAADHARRTSSAMDITLVGGEPGLPYRLNLTRYLGGEVGGDELAMVQRAWLEENRIELVEGEVSEIDRYAKLVRFGDGRTLFYDRLVLAMGAHPFVPPLPGADLPGVFTLRTVGDADAIVARVERGGRCVVIGGGLLGLEAAGAVQQRGMIVTVLEGYGYLLPRQLDEEGGRLLQRFVSGRGIIVRNEVRARAIVGDDEVRGVDLGNGEVLDADLVVVATGVRPNSHLARRCGLEVRHGVVVDDRLATADPAVFGAGDVAEHSGRVYGIWPASHVQGTVAGINAAGGEATFTSIPPSNQLKVMDVDVVSMGDVHPSDGSYRTFEARGDGEYRRLISRDGRLVGAILVGNATHAGALRAAIEEGRSLLEIGEIVDGFPAPVHGE